VGGITLLDIKVTTYWRNVDSIALAEERHRNGTEGFAVELLPSMCKA
jgi:hypothetical protein